jgi:hypothetical protein
MMASTMSSGTVGATELDGEPAARAVHSASGLGGGKGGGGGGGGEKEEVEEEVAADDDRSADEPPSYSAAGSAVEEAASAAITALTGASALGTRGCAVYTCGVLVPDETETLVSTKRSSSQPSAAPAAKYFAENPKHGSAAGILRASLGARLSSHRLPR